MNEVSKILWQLVSFLSIIGFFIYLIEGDKENVILMLIFGGIADTRIMVMELQ